MFPLDFLHFSVPTNKINHPHKIFKWQGFSFYKPSKKNHPIEIPHLTLNSTKSFYYKEVGKLMLKGNDNDQ